MIRIEKLNQSGLGVATDGKCYERVLPGEEIESQPDGTAKILTPVSTRVSPPCRHFKSCGGCILQHASDQFVQDWKVQVFERAMQARGLKASIRSTHVSPPSSRRRAGLSAKRTKKGAIVGFHKKGSDELAETPDCRLLSPSILAGWPAFEALAKCAASRKSEVKITVTDTLNGLDIHLETEKKLTADLRISLAALAVEHDIARLTWNDETIVTRRPPVQSFGNAYVAAPAGAFLQATREGEQAMIAAVCEAARGAHKIADLFSGAGTFTLPLAKNSQVHAVEGEANMLQALDQAWRSARGLKRVTTETRDLFRRPLEPDELALFDHIVIDPPRAGAKAQIETIARSSVASLTMISCNPVTFARDSKTLIEAGFSLEWSEVIDQFRWSSHIELVGNFKRF